MVPSAELRSYYDRPILKAPVWRWPIPAYFFTGGMAGASALLAAGGRARGLRRLARRSRLTSLAALGASTVLLVDDLGRPDRFYNMLRVLKPTSPMSVGSWLLAAFAPAVGAGVLSDLTGRAPGLGAAADAAAAALGPAVSTYTAVVLANTAVPAWHAAGRFLPAVFASSSAAAAGGMAVTLGADETGPARRFAVAGAIGEWLATAAMERHSGPEGAPYRKANARRLLLAARMCTVAGTAALVAPGRRRRAEVLGGQLLVAGSVLTRFGVVAAGRQSAADPAEVVGPQRARLEGA